MRIVVKNKQTKNIVRVNYTGERSCHGCYDSIDCTGSIKSICTFTKTHLKETSELFLKQIEKRRF